jgi:L-lactate dehydrogenase
MKIGIVGSGYVGATAAYALVMQGIGRKIVLIDINKQKAEAEAEDILHAVPFSHRAEIIAGDYSDLKDAKVVILTAGVNQKPGETRLQLLERNTKVYKQVVPSVLEHAPNAILLIATNPVDVMTFLANHFARNYGVPSSKIIGTGTTLDTARFRALLAQKLGVDPQHIHAYVVGEHGDSEVLTWSLVTIGGIPLKDFIQSNYFHFSDKEKQFIDESVRKAAYKIIEGKGATYYGVGGAIARIVKAILYDQRALLTVSSLHSNILEVQNVALSLPHLIGGAGIISTFPLPLNKEEQQQLSKSASIIRRAIDQLETYLNAPEQ